jgi:formylglycine-generating enzyme required for sulfatase activity
VELFIRSIAVLLISVCPTQGAWAQFNVSGPGFLPDENGMNPDTQQSGKSSPKLDTATVVKDCAECPAMVVIPAGSFVMGADKYIAEKPLHSVVIRSFLMGRTEVTQRLWLHVMGSNPSYFLACGPSCPVENVSWDEAQQFVAKFNQKTGQKYRLPSEAEWEYAARAGTTTEWSFGNDESKLGSYGWFSLNTAYQTEAVAQKLPNAFGLFDVHGNVSEWTQDCWHENYVRAPTDGSAWTVACATGSLGHGLGVIRGGSWNHGSADLRSGIRFKYYQSNRDTRLGFRLVRDL